MWPQLRSGRLRAVDAGITVSVYGSGGIHEYLDLNLNRGGSAYHEYEYEKARSIMSLNSKKAQNSSVFNLNTGLFMTCSAVPLGPVHVAWRRVAWRLPFGVGLPDAARRLRPY